MQDEPAPGIPVTSKTSLTPRSIHALGSTQSWARFAGSALFGLALLKLVQSALSIAHTHSMTAGQGHFAGPAIVYGQIFATLIEIGVYCLTGVFALRYAARLDRVRPPWLPDADDIAGALGAQHRYWRLQGIVTLVTIGLVVLAIVVAIIGVMIRAAAH